MRPWITQLRKGLVELGVLAALRSSETYGYQMLQILENAQGPAITRSAVYPILDRLAEEGCIKFRIIRSPIGPPRRYYRLTALGHTRLRQMELYWRQINTSVDSLLKGMKRLPRRRDVHS